MRTAVAFGLVLGAAVVPRSAWAASGSELPGPPDSAGNYMYCNLNAASKSAGSYVNARVYVSCQYGPTTGSVTELIIRIWKDNNAAYADVSFVAGQPVYAGGSAEVLQNGGGKFKASVFPNGTGYPSNAWCLGSAQGCTAPALQSVKIDGTTRAGANPTTNQTATASYPAYPDNYWPGGGPGTLAWIACFTSVPVTPLFGEAAQFDARCSTAGAGATYAWTFSAGTGSDTSGRLVTHTLPASGDTVVTLSVTQEGTTLSVSRTYSGTAGQTGADDTTCPSGWGWLNPAAFGSILRCLFVPTSSLTDSFTSVGNDMATHYPTGPVVWVVSTAGSLISSFTSGATGDMTGDCQWGPSISVGGTLLGGSGGGYPTSKLVLINNCPDGDASLAGWLTDVRHFVYWGFSAVMVWGFAMFVVRLFGGVSSGPGGDE